MSSKTKIVLFLSQSILFTCITGSCKTPYPIDLVYTWVDGSDQNWLATKLAHYPQDLVRELISKAALINGIIDGRFRDNQELRYSLRSVWQYAPWVNHIYIITMNQRPSWLMDHPKISIVDHTEIFKDKRDLPSFNSQAIESNLHRIPGLCDHFIYFNDDFFLGAPVYSRDFFRVSTGAPLFFLEKSESPAGEPIPGETAYRRAWRNTNNFLNTYYTPEPRNFFKHAPYALRVSSMQEFENMHPKIFRENSQHKFRSTDDFNVTNGLLHYYWLYNDKAKIGKIRNIYASIKDDLFIERTEKKLERITRLRPKTFCLEDNMEEHFIKTKQLMHDFFIHYYPEPAPWEREAR